MPGQIPAKIKNARYRIAMSIQREIAHEIAREKTGRELKLLVDQPHVARTEADAPDVDTRVILSKEAPGRRVRLANDRGKPRLRSAGLSRLLTKGFFGKRT